MLFSATNVLGYRLSEICTNAACTNLFSNEILLLPYP